MTSLFAFIIALCVLIAVHEYGHYRVAVACGVKVLRFSIGFGKPLITWTSAKSGTEFALCILPLGGYVRMLDEREAPVDPIDKHRSFNAQPLLPRVAIVAAGPLANLLLAAALYTLVNWIGVDRPQPILASPAPASLAHRAGLTGGQWVHQIAIAQGDPAPVRTFEDLRWHLTQAVVLAEDVTLWIAPEKHAPRRAVKLPLSELGVREIDAALFDRIGIVGPWTAPTIGAIMQGSAAQKAGLRTGDWVHSVEGQPVTDGQHLRALIRAAATPSGQAITQRWSLEREGQRLDLLVTPSPEKRNQRWVGYLGAYVGSAPQMEKYQLGWIDGLGEGLSKTAEVSWLTLKTMGLMLMGEASIKNLSGPLTIADYAGKSASQGITPYLLFLALISVSLGVLNLLPLPLLDGGHLMYYLWEGITGRAVSEQWLDGLQRAGATVLVVMMVTALFNDVTRLLV